MYKSRVGNTCQEAVAVIQDRGDGGQICGGPVSGPELWSSWVI